MKIDEGGDIGFGVGVGQSELKKEDVRKIESEKKERPEKKDEKGVEK